MGVIGTGELCGGHVYSSSCYSAGCGYFDFDSDAINGDISCDESSTVTNTHANDEYTSAEFICWDGTGHGGTWCG